MENSSPNPSFSICDIRIQKQMSRSFGKSFPQKIALPKLRPHCSATCPNTWRAEHQRKMSFPLSRKISSPPNQESKEHFSLVLPREARQWRNDTSVRFSFEPLRAPRVRLVVKILRILSEVHSNFVQYTPPKLEIGNRSRNGVGAKRRHKGIPAKNSRIQKVFPRSAWLTRLPIQFYE